MKRRAFLPVLLAVTLIAPPACRPPKKQLSQDITTQIEALRKEKATIERKMQDIETAHAALQKSTAETLDALETIENALGEVKKRLDMIEKLPVTAPAQPKRLPLPVSILLVVIIVLSVLTALKLHSIRVREIRGKRAEESSRETKSESAKTQP